MDRRIRWHYTTTILRLRIGARLTRLAYRNCKFHNFARTISRHADGISRYSVPPSAGPLLPLNMDDECADDWRESYTNAISGNRLWLTNRFHHTCRLSQLLGARTLKYYRTSQQSIGLVYCNVVYTIQTITISKKNVPPFACYNSGICPIAYAIYFFALSIYLDNFGNSYTAKERKQNMLYCFTFYLPHLYLVFLNFLAKHETGKLHLFSKMLYCLRKSLSLDWFNLVNFYY